MSSTDCVICQELLGEKLSFIISCGHVFHSECLGQWLQVSRVCPLCKINVPRLRAIPLHFSPKQMMRTFWEDWSRKHDGDGLAAPMVLTMLMKKEGVSSMQARIEEVARSIVEMKELNRQLRDENFNAELKLAEEEERLEKVQKLVEEKNGRTSTFEHEKNRMANILQKVKVQNAILQQLDKLENLKTSSDVEYDSEQIMIDLDCETTNRRDEFSPYRMEVTAKWLEAELKGIAKEEYDPQTAALKERVDMMREMADNNRQQKYSVKSKLKALSQKISDLHLKCAQSDPQTLARLNRLDEELSYANVRRQ